MFIIRFGCEKYFIKVSLILDGIAPLSTYIIWNNFKKAFSGGGHRKLGRIQLTRHINYAV